MPEMRGYSYILDDDEEFNKMIRDDLLRDAVETIGDMNAMELKGDNHDNGTDDRITGD